MVAACGVAERTVAAWVARAGQHGQPVHQPLVHHGRVDVPHVQADALWVKLVGRRAWMAMAVPSRRWLGGVIRPRRDLVLITTLVQMGRASAWTLALLVGVDGLASDVTAFLRVFRQPVRTSRRGRPCLVLEPGVLLGHVVKRYVPRQVVSVERRVVRGTNETIAAVLAAPHRGTGSKTADRERRKATVRASLAPLGRRGRAIAHPEAALTAGLWRVGGAYHVCWRPQRLRLAAPAGAPWQWHERTPAMAAGLTDHRWTRLERLRDHVPPPVWVAPTRRGRPPKRARQPAMVAAT
jgi:hypothetical protein